MDSEHEKECQTIQNYPVVSVTSTLLLIQTKMPMIIRVCKQRIIKNNEKVWKVLRHTEAPQ